MAKYDHIDFKPPQSVRDAYKRGLKLHEEGKTGSGLEQATVSMARRLSSGDAVSPEWARKGNRFWGRNERFLSEEKDSPAYASAMLWGGRPGMSWFRKLYRQMEAADQKTNSLEANKIIIKDGEHCVVSEDGSRSFGCYPSEDQAKKRLQQVEFFKREGNQVSNMLVNFRSVVNRSMIRRDSRNGDEFVIIRSATLPDNVVMNGGLYPAEEIENGYMTLEGTLAPLGHPMDANGNFIPATSQYAIDNYYVGAANENVVRENGRVFLDKAINVSKAMQTDKGKRLMDRIKALESGKGEPIHTSTGVFLQQREEEGMNANGQEYTWVAENMRFDHDAILLDEPGAAQPEQGVGIAVNSDGIQHKVFNVDLEPYEFKTNEESPQTLLQKLLKAVGFADSGNTAYNHDSKYLLNEGDDPMKDRIIGALKKANRYKDGMSDDEMMNAYEDMMMGKAKNMSEKKNMTDGDGKERSKMNADETVKIVKDAVSAAMAPVVAELDAIKANAKAKEDAEKMDAVAVVVNSNLLTKEQAEAMPLESLVALAANSQKAPAGLNTSFSVNHKDTDFDYAGMEAPE